MTVLLQPIPLNIVTGFLGAGKTTAILSMLKQVPVGERWAVLVNEFGEVGIDGALLQQSGFAIKQVAGGCLCCTTSAAFQTGLNQLIKSARPDRILIEPSGLGHPLQLLKQLMSPYYQGVLSLKATLCLLDARNLANPRYLGHPSFIDQIELADVLVATKAELYDDFDRETFLQFVQQLEPTKAVVAFSEAGAVSTEWLNTPRLDQLQARYPQAHQIMVPEATAVSPVNRLMSTPAPATRLRLLPAGMSCYQNVSQNMQSVGWRLTAAYCFDFERFCQIAVELQQQQHVWRLKAVINTQKGAFSVNFTATERTIMAVSSLSDAKIEIIREVSADPIPIEALSQAWLEALYSAP